MCISNFHISIKTACLHTATHTPRPRCRLHCTSNVVKPAHLYLTWLDLVLRLKIAVRAAHPKPQSFFGFTAPANKCVGSVWVRGCGVALMSSLCTCWPACYVCFSEHGMMGLTVYHRDKLLLVPDWTNVLFSKLYAARKTCTIWIEYKKRWVIFQSLSWNAAKTGLKSGTVLYACSIWKALQVERLFKNWTLTDW